MFVRVDNKQDTTDILTTEPVLSALQVHEALLQHLPEYRHTAHTVDSYAPVRFGVSPRGEQMWLHPCYVRKRPLARRTMIYTRERAYEFPVWP